MTTKQDFKKKTVPFYLYLPAGLYMRLQAHLYSPLEGRVPYKARNQLFEKLLEEYLLKVEGQKRELPND